MNTFPAMATSNLLRPVVKRLEGKVALITGGASGIGAATARVFAHHGAKVVVADIQDELGSSLCKDISSENDTVFFTHCDVTKESDVQNAVETAVSKYGKLDIMYSNAGIGGSLDTKVSETKDSNLKQVFDVNVFGAFLAAKHAVKAMIPAKRGSIIFTSSVAAVAAGSFSHAYVSSKHAVNGLATDLCVELGQHGIRVNCISPYYVATPALFKMIEEAEKKNEIPSMTTGARDRPMLDPADVAQAAVFLASDESRFVSGLNLVIDGGYSKTNPVYTMILKNHDT